MLWVLEAPPQNPQPTTPTIFCGSVPFKDTHLRYPKTPFLACCVQWYGWSRRHPRTHTIFCGVVQFKDTHLTDPKTLFLTCGVQWYGRSGRRPRTRKIFCGIVQFKDTHLRDQKDLFCLVVAVLSVLRAPPQNPYGILWHCVVQRHPSSNIILPYRYPRPPFLACGVQWYGWLGCHPRTHTVFCGIVWFKDTHPRDPKSLFLACGVQWYGWLGRHPSTRAVFCSHILWQYFF